MATAGVRTTARRPLVSDAQRTAYDIWERRQHWYKLAVELGQRDDFLALIEAERRDAVEEYKRAHSL